MKKTNTNCTINQVNYRNTREYLREAAEYYYSCLSKGDVIPYDIVSELFDCGIYPAKSYKICCFQFIEMLDRVFVENGYNYVFKMGNDGSIHVCSDAEAVEYCRRKQETCVKKMYRFSRKLEGVNRKNLTPKERLVFEKQKRLSDLMVSYLKDSRIKICSRFGHLPKKIRPQFRLRKRRCRRVRL